MILTTMFTVAGVPTEGLSPTVTIRDYNGIIIADGEVTEEIGGGFYKYNFSWANDSVEYAVIFDGGNSLWNTERWKIVQAWDQRMNDILYYWQAALNRKISSTNYSGRFTKLEKLIAVLLEKIIENAPKDIEFPEMPKLDVSPLLERIGELEERIVEIRNVPAEEDKRKKMVDEIRKLVKTVEDKEREEEKKLEALINNLFI